MQTARVFPSVSLLHTVCAFACFAQLLDSWLSSRVLLVVFLVSCLLLLVSPFQLEVEHRLLFVSLVCVIATRKLEWVNLGNRCIGILVRW